MRQPRRSRRLEKEEPLDAFVDADTENEGVPSENVIIHTMFHVATKNKEEYIFEEY